MNPIYKMIDQRHSKLYLIPQNIYKADTIFHFPTNRISW